MFGKPNPLKNLFGSKSTPVPIKSKDGDELAPESTPAPPAPPVVHETSVVGPDAEPEPTPEPTPEPAPEPAKVEEVAEVKKPAPPAKAVPPARDRKPQARRGRSNR